MVDLFALEGGEGNEENSYLYFLSNPGYVVFMGWAGETQFNYKSLKAVPFRKDRTQRIKKKMGTVPK